MNGPGSLARLLWGLVRPWLLWPGLLFVAAAPEFFRQVQGGGADLPVACYVVLFAVGAGVWLLAPQAARLIATASMGATRRGKMDFGRKSSIGVSPGLCRSVPYVTLCSCIMKCRD